jgi:glutaminyl-peptide cyclotransferase
MFSNQRAFQANIEDDHIPFSERGVPVVHLIPVPFPKVWHQEEDTMQNVDQQVVHAFSLILRIFFTEMLRL